MAVRKSAAKKWRKQDDSDIVTALRRQATIKRVLQTDPTEDFTEDVVGKSDGSYLKRVKKMKTLLTVSDKDLQLGEKFGKKKKERKAVLEKLRAPVDLWDDKIVKGDKAPKLTCANALMPAVVAPTSGYSMNPEKGVWEETLGQEAAIARHFVGDDSDESVDLKNELTEKVEPATVKKEEPCAESENDSDDELVLALLEDAERLESAKKKELVRQANRDKGFATHIKRQQIKKDLAVQDELLEDVEKDITRSELATQYKKHLEEEHKKLMQQGVLPTGEIRQGRKVYIEDGDEVALPEGLAESQGSLRKIPLPSTNSALRDRLKSAVKRGAIELPAQRRRQPKKRKHLVQVRTH